MNGTLRFLHLVRYSAVCLFLLLSHIHTVTAQDEETNQSAPVQIRLKPDKNTIMLGEPLYIAFEVMNLSGETLCLGVGGDYRNRFGRPESFKVSIRRDDGSELPQIEVASFGGFIGCQYIEAGETFTVRLFLSHWAIIERTGSYRINVKRKMGFSGSDASSEWHLKYSMLADVNAEFKVIPTDENRMGGIITSLGSIMLDINDPRAAESARALASIQDKRVISYFAEALRKFAESEMDLFGNEVSIRSRSIAALATYDDDRAMEALQGAMDSPIDDTRLDIATAFGDSPHRSSTQLLLKMQDDKYWFVRLRVAQGLDRRKSKESLATLQKLLKDEREEVRNAAKESLKNINQ